MSRHLPLGRERVLIIYPLRICRRLIAADAITDNGIRMAELEPPRKDRLKKLLPDKVCGTNTWAAFR